jgi:hypothetical protein
VSTKTTKGHDAAEEAEETQEAVTGEEGREEPAVKATVKKRVRRVRVVEIIDDEDLDEVLDQLDAEEKAEDEAPEEAEESRPATARAAAKTSAAEEAPDQEAEGPRPARTRAARKAAASAEPEDREATGGLRRLILSPIARAVAAIVVIAALATFGLFEWRQASDLSAKQEARKQVEAKLTEFGNVIGTYDTTQVKTSQDKIASYMVGDALSVFQANAAKAQTLTDPAKAKVTTVSKARQVIVGDVNGEFATGLIAVDITLTTDQGSAPMSNNYLVVDLVKQKGVWKVSKLTPIGSPSGTSTDGTGGTGGTTPGIGATPTAKPKK